MVQKGGVWAGEMGQLLKAWLTIKRKKKNRAYQNVSFKVALLMIQRPPQARIIISLW